MIYTDIYLYIYIYSVVTIKNIFPPSCRNPSGKATTQSLQGLRSCVIAPSRGLKMLLVNHQPFNGRVTVTILTIVNHLKTIVNHPKTIVNHQNRQE